MKSTFIWLSMGGCGSYRCCCLFCCWIFMEAFGVRMLYEL